MINKISEHGHSPKKGCSYFSHVYEKAIAKLKKIYLEKRLAGLELAPKIQDVLEEYSDILRKKKLELLERYILEGLDILLHKKMIFDTFFFFWFKLFNIRLNFLK